MGEEPKEKWPAYIYVSKEKCYVRDDIVDAMLEALEVAMRRWGTMSYGEVKIMADAIAKAKGKES